MSEKELNEVAQLDLQTLSGIQLPCPNDPTTRLARQCGGSAFHRISTVGIPEALERTSPSRPQFRHAKRCRVAYIISFAMQPTVITIIRMPTPEGHGFHHHFHFDMNQSPTTATSTTLHPENHCTTTHFPILIFPTTAHASNTSRFLKTSQKHAADATDSSQIHPMRPPKTFIASTPLGRIA